MEELIFVAVLLFLSIIESIARSRKQRQGGGQVPDARAEAQAELEREWAAERERLKQRRPRPRPRMSDVPSYDDDTSFDARTAGREEGRSFEVGRGEAESSFDEIASAETERGRRAASSESMIPADIWEEIAGLAREAKVELPTPRQRPRPRIPQTQLPPERRVPQQTRPTPKPSPMRGRPSAPKPRPSVLPAPALEGTPDHAVHASHVGFGSDPSERTRSAQDGLDPLARSLSADAAAIRLQLRGGGAHALRQALILQEVLGPPVGSRD
jgi:hypothetical protein